MTEAADDAGTLTVEAGWVRTFMGGSEAVGAGDGLRLLRGACTRQRLLYEEKTETKTLLTGFTRRVDRELFGNVSQNSLEIIFRRENGDDFLTNKVHRVDAILGLANRLGNIELATTSRSGRGLEWIADDRVPVLGEVAVCPLGG